VGRAHTLCNFETLSVSPVNATEGGGLEYSYGLITEGVALFFLSCCLQGMKKNEKKFVAFSTL
jgi:hypothetical protein